MAVVTYPSAEIPGQPRISLELPEGWTAGARPGVAFMAFREDAGAGFTPNCVVTVRRVAQSVSLDSAMSESGSELSTLAEYAEMTAVVAEIGEREVGIREYAFRDTHNDINVFQLQAIALDAVDGRAKDLVTLTISHGPENLDESLDELRDIARSLELSRD